MTTSSCIKNKKKSPYVSSTFFPFPIKDCEDKTVKLNSPTRKKKEREKEVPFVQFRICYTMHTKHIIITA